MVIWMMKIMIYQICSAVLETSPYQMTTGSFSTCSGFLTWGPTSFRSIFHYKSSTELGAPPFFLKPQCVIHHPTTGPGCTPATAATSSTLGPGPIWLAGSFWRQLKGDLSPLSATEECSRWLVTVVTGDWQKSIKAFFRILAFTYRMFNARIL